MSKHLLLFLLLAGASFAWLGGWSYMTPINISDPGSALTDYQVQIDPKLYNNTGLVGSWHFSETSGTTTADSSGYGNEGTITNGPAAVSGKSGSALLFDGTNDHVDLGNAPALDVADGTISMWVYINALPASEKRDYIWNNWGLLTDQIGLGLDNTGKVIYTQYISNSPYSANSPAATVAAGNWYHIVASWGSGGMRLYVNNVSKGTNAATGHWGFGNYATVKIGGSSATSAYFNGTIDEVRIYNRSISAQEISDLYTGTKARLDYADLRFTQPYNVYETPITISGTGSDLADYQALINITNQTILSHMRADGADLRLFSSASSTPYSSAGLAYWIESINSTQAKVWVKANISSGGSTIYMYYGNVSAGAQSNGTKVFEFFDDFESGLMGDWTVSGWAASAASVGAVTPHGAYFARTITNGAYFQRTLSLSSSGMRIDISGYGYGNPCCHATRFYENAVLRLSWPDGLSTWLDQSYILTSATPTIKFDHATDNSYPAAFDDIRVRKYSATEPLASTGSETVKSAGNEAQLNHWLESDRSAWVKVPSVPAGASAISMYYGNPSAAYNNSQGGSNTFIIYNDGMSLAGTTQVTLAGYSAPTWSTEAGAIKATGGTSNRGGFLYFNQPTGVSNHALEMTVRSSVTGNYEPQYGFRFDTAQSSAQRGEAMYLETDSYNKFDIVSSAGTGTLSAAQTRDSTLKSRWKFVKNGNSRELFENGISKVSDSESWDAQNVGIYFYDGSQSTSAWFWDFRARKYSSPEPSTAQGTEQQAPPPDTAKPSVAIQSPANTTYNTNAISVNFTATDDIGVGSCTVRLNGTVNSSTCSNYTLTLSNGAYTLNITANDTFGNLNSSAVSFTVSILPSVSNSTTTNSNGIGNVSLNGIPTGASRIVYSVGSNSYSKSFTVSTGVASVRILAKATLQGTPAPGKTLTFQAS